MQEQGRVYARGCSWTLLREVPLQSSSPSVDLHEQDFWRSQRQDGVVSVPVFFLMTLFICGVDFVFFCENYLYTPVCIPSVSQCVASSHPELAVIPHRQILAGMRESLSSEPSEK